MYLPKLLNPPFLRLLFAAMVLMVPLLMGLSLATQNYPALNSRFDIDGEATIPAWYSTIILFSVALCSLVIYDLRRRADADAKWPYFWLAFAVAYCFFSIDEAARIHEAFDMRLGLKWIFYYAPIAAAFFVYCAYYLVFIETDKRLSRWVVCGITVFGLGALGMETWTYVFYSPKTVLAETIVEESLELIGTTLVLIGCLKGIRHLSMCETLIQTTLRETKFSPPTNL